MTVKHRPVIRADQFGERWWLECACGRWGGAPYEEEPPGWAAHLTKPAKPRRELPPRRLFTATPPTED